MKLNNQYFCVNQRFNQAGFSLVELMVGLVIGLLATLAIMQMMGTFDSVSYTHLDVYKRQIHGSIDNREIFTFGRFQVLYFCQQNTRVAH